MEDVEIKSQEERGMDGSETQTFKSSCIKMVWCGKVDDKHKASLLQGIVDFAEVKRSWEAVKFATILTILEQGQNLKICVSLETTQGCQLTTTVIKLEKTIPKTK